MAAGIVVAVSVAFVWYLKHRSQHALWRSKLSNLGSEANAPPLVAQITERSTCGVFHHMW